MTKYTFRETLYFSERLSCSKLCTVCVYVCVWGEGWQTVPWMTKSVLNKCASPLPHHKLRSCSYVCWMEVNHDLYVHYLFESQHQRKLMDPKEMFSFLTALRAASCPCPPGEPRRPKAHRFCSSYKWPREENLESPTGSEVTGQRGRRAWGWCQRQLVICLPSVMLCPPPRALSPPAGTRWGWHVG